jgi:hypothetical protein
MVRKNLQLLPGQNLRYTGRFFPGFVKGQPYMIYIGIHSVYQIRVSYNGIEIIVDKYLIDVVR